MTAAGHPEPRAESKKFEAIIYLSSNRPLHLPDFLAEFQRNWPLHMLEKTGSEPHRAFFRGGRSDFALDLHHTPVPHAVTDPVAGSTLDWPAAPAALANHVAYIGLTGSASTKGALTLASDLTRAIASLLPVTDSLAVSWLKGPALNRTQKFIATAHEMFSTGLYPLPLWVAARWDADSHFLFTRGMAQFDAPEIILAHQPDPAPLMVDYLFQLALSLITSHHPIAVRGIVDGPHGCLKVSSGTLENAQNVLILEPSR